MSFRKSKLIPVTPIVFFLIIWAFLINCGKVSGSEVPSDEITNTVTVGAPTATSTPPSCTSDEHLDLSGTKCLKWSIPGALTPPPAGPLVIATPTPVAKANFSIYGYGPAGANIKMTGVGVLETTETDANGYFEFVNPPFPTFLAYMMGDYYPELCFQATDTHNLLSKPVCIPALAKKAFSPKVGPVILPPTLSVSDGITIKETQLTALGSTLPNSEVIIFVAKKAGRNQFKLVGEVSAFYLPIYKVRSDQNGNYEFSLPTNVSDEWKIFAAAVFQGSPSPKSNTLTYYIKPVSYKLVEIYEDTLAKIKPGLLSIIIGLEFLILFILILFKRNVDSLTQDLSVNNRLKNIQAHPGGGNIK